MAAKWSLIRRLFNLGLDREQVQSIYALIDWMLRLRPDLELELDQRVVLLEKEKNMPPITPWERRGIEIGFKQGLQEGRVSLILQQLDNRLGELPERVRKQVGSLPPAHIDALAADVFGIKSVAGLRSWLKSQMPRDVLDSKAE